MPTSCANDAAVRQLNEYVATFQAGPPASDARLRIALAGPHDWLSLMGWSQIVRMVLSGPAGRGGRPGDPFLERSSAESIGEPPHIIGLFEDWGWTRSQAVPWLNARIKLRLG